MEDEGKEGLELTEAQIAVHWKEEDYYYPSPKFIGQANASDPDIFERFNQFRQVRHTLHTLCYACGHGIPFLLAVLLISPLYRLFDDLVRVVA